MGAIALLMVRWTQLIDLIKPQGWETAEKKSKPDGFPSASVLNHFTLVSPTECQFPAVPEGFVSSEDAQRHPT